MKNNISLFMAAAFTLSMGCMDAKPPRQQRTPEEIEAARQYRARLEALSPEAREEFLRNARRPAQPTVSRPLVSMAGSGMQGTREYSPRERSQRELIGPERDPRAEYQPEFNREDEGFSEEGHVERRRQ